MQKPKVSPGQLLIFPTPESGLVDSASGSTVTATMGATPGLLETGSLHGRSRCEIVISGTYRKDFEGLKRTYEEFRDLGCAILSPSSVSPVREEDGFVYMQGEETEAPESIELRHLGAIQRANFVWLHAPSGYIGPTAAVEIGFAKAAGVPVFARDTLRDPVLRSFIESVRSPEEVIGMLESHRLPLPSPAIQSFQHYYRRVAVQRGYQKEDAKDCLILMLEEVGELARAIRKREKIARHGDAIVSNEAQEVADVFIYVVHMANVLGFDLAEAVKEKEIRNLNKYFEALTAK